MIAITSYNPIFDYNHIIIKEKFPNWDYSYKFFPFMGTSYVSQPLMIFMHR